MTSTGKQGKQPDWLEPELATLTRDRFSDPAWLYERKLDGERCLAFRSGDSIRMMTRNQKEVSNNYPEIAGALREQGTRDFIIDGEIVAFQGSETSFELLQSRIHVTNPGPQLLRKVPVFYYIFDVLYADDQDVRPRPLRERKDVLASLLSFDDPLRFTEHRDTEGEAFYAEACKAGWEGLIAKLADSPYRAGRSKDWLKFKCETNQEFVIGGWTDPQRSRVAFGALLLGYYDPDGKLAYAGKVGTGFDTRTLRSLLAEMEEIGQDQPPFDYGDLPHRDVHWVRPELVAQIGFSEWTTAGQLRHPRYLGLRQDKDPASVVREVPG